MLYRVTRLLVSLAIVVVFVTLAAGAQNSVAAGTDYLVTGPGTIFDLSARGFSTDVNFRSHPSPVVCSALIGQGTCLIDTIIQRQQDTPIDGTTPSPIQIIYLSLCSANPAGGTLCFGVPNNNGFHYKIFATLDPRALPNNTGTITFAGNSSGGTMSSSFTVNLLATFQTTDGGPDLTPFRASFTVTSSGTAWTSTPPNPATYFEIMAPYPAQQANVHTMLPGQPQIVIVDFFFVTFVRELHFGRGVCHVASLACAGGIIVANPPPIALFWLICVFLRSGDEGLSLDQIADLMVPTPDFGTTVTQNMARDKVQEPVGRASVGVSSLAGPPRTTAPVARN